MRLKDKTIIVTGGANGLGRAYCEHFVHEGANVVIADVDGEEGAAFAAQLQETVGRPCAATVRTDVTSEADTMAMAKSAIDRFGRIDVLLNNAGTYPHVDFEDITLESWRKVMSINLDSVFLCIKAVLPQMKEQTGGKIVNVATNLVWIGLPSMSHYIASKGGIIGMTRALAREFGKYSITVNAIAPGAVIKPLQLINEDSRRRVEEIVSHQSVQWCQRAVDLLGPVTFLCSTDSDFISGQVLTVDGGLTNH